MLVRESAKDKHYCEIVGRSINFLKEHQDKWWEPCEVGSVDGRSIRLARVFDTLFKLDPPTLQMMSIASCVVDEAKEDKEGGLGQELSLKKRPSWAVALRRMSGFGGLRHTASEKSIKTP